MMTIYDATRMLIDKLVKHLDIIDTYRPVVELVLMDGDGMCIVSSDITCDGKKGNCFEITNPETKRKYLITIKTEEI